MPTKKVKKSPKKKPLTANEKLQKLIAEGKILSKPIYEGETGDVDKITPSRSIPSGYAQIGVSQGLTFSEDPDSRASNWFRADRWVIVNADPKYLDEVTNVLEDYLVDKLADNVEAILGDE
jgi:hypothetical protein